MENPGFQINERLTFGSAGRGSRDSTGARTGVEANQDETGNVPAEVIALIYIHRWTIEIFFRFFKHVLGCRHLLSAQPGGIAIQAYCALIACLLITLWTGRKPTQRTYEMLGWYFLGWASAEELSAQCE